MRCCLFLHALFDYILDCSSLSLLHSDGECLLTWYGKALSHVDNRTESLSGKGPEGIVILIC